MEKANNIAHDTRTALHHDDLCLAVCNESPSRYWAQTTYKEEAVRQVCAELTNEWMFALVTFHGNGKISFTVSQKTWERQQGHYPVVMDLFTSIAQLPRLAHSEGSFIVWLEDGMWEWCQQYSRRAPIVAFGRSIVDTATFLIPDPAFLGSLGYVEDRTKSEEVASRIAWRDRRPTIFWRGAATGIGIEGSEWMNTARAKLALAAKAIGDPMIVDAKLTRVKHLPPRQIQNLASEGILHDEVPFETFFTCKYVVDVDGYHCAWKSLFLKLMTGSVVLKIDSPFEQWYHRALRPWRHYIPISQDLKELTEIYGWLLAHDDAAQEIAYEGAKLVSQMTLEPAIHGVVALVDDILSNRRC